MKRYIYTAISRTRDTNKTNNFSHAPSLGNILSSNRRDVYSVLRHHIKPVFLTKIGGYSLWISIHPTGQTTGSPFPRIARAFLSLDCVLFSRDDILIYNRIRITYFIPIRFCSILDFSFSLLKVSVSVEVLPTHVFLSRYYGCVVSESYVVCYQK